MFCYRFIKGLTRRKTSDFQHSDTPFRRCMNVFDLTALGIGSMMDAGLYVVVGQLAHSVAGPAVIVSFLIAAVASLLAGLCYAEFASRVNRAGSGYIYTYVAMGEIWAFMAGWAMVTEYILSAASLAAACSQYINFFFNGSIYRFFEQEFGVWNAPGLAPFPDLVAFGLVVVATIVIAFGVKQSKLVLDITVATNLVVVTFIVFVGAYYSNADNWSTMDKFAPYGWSGILTAASSCFYCFIGFDTIPSATEEAINPSITIVAAILLSLGISFFAYLGVLSVLTMMINYNELKEIAPLAEAFAARAFAGSEYIVSVGALCAILSSLLAQSFATPRLIYSISYDGLIFGCFTKVSKERRIPIRAVVVSGAVSAFLAFLFEIKQLVELVSICALANYTLVSLSVILTRYQTDVESTPGEVDLKQPAEWSLRTLFLKGRDWANNNRNLELPQREGDSVSTACHASPNERSNTTANVTILILVLSMLAVCIYIKTWIMSTDNIHPLTIFAISLYGLVAVVCVVVLLFLPRNSASFPFMAPGVPLLPAISIFVNLLLLMLMHRITYLRFVVWMLIGLLVYFVYGYHNSIEGKKPKSFELELDPVTGIPVYETKTNLPTK